MNVRDGLRRFGAPVVLATLAAVYFVHSSRASGIPATKPFTYTGQVTDDSAAPLANKTVTVAVFDGETGGNQVCAGASSAQTSADGRFAIPLEANCTAVIEGSTSLFVEVAVSSVPLSPRTQIGAVPYAASSVAATQVTGNVAAGQVTGAIPATQISSGGTTVEQRLDAIEPSGTIVAYAGATAPPGWLLCDGTPVSRTTYAALHQAIGDAWGAGNGTTTFNLPDLRGRFLRGVDHGAGNDPDSNGRIATNGGNTGDAVGSIEGDQLRAHTHNFGAGGGGATNNPGYPTSTGDDVFGHSSLPTSAAGGSETRPVNANVNWIIKT